MNNDVLSLSRRVSVAIVISPGNNSSTQSRDWQNSIIGDRYCTTTIVCSRRCSKGAYRTLTNNVSQAGHVCNWCSNVVYDHRLVLSRSVAVAIVICPGNGIGTLCIVSRWVTGRTCDRTTTVVCSRWGCNCSRALTCNVSQVGHVCNWCSNVVYDHRLVLSRSVAVAIVICPGNGIGTLCIVSRWVTGRTCDRTTTVVCSRWGCNCS